MLLIGMNERYSGMNNQNLKPFTVINASENGAKGGKASGESKRKRKQLREYVTEILERPASELTGAKGSDKTNAAYIALQTVEAAKSGNIRALRLLYEIMGELDRDKINIEINQQEVKEAYERGQKEAIDDVVQMLDDDTLRKIAGLTPAK